MARGSLSRRLKDAPVEVHIPAAVVAYLGRVTQLGLIGGFVLVLVALLSSHEVDAVQATLITAFLALGGNAGVALGAILATTGKPPSSEPTPVTVENSTADPVPTAPQADPVAPPSPDAVSYDVGPTLT